ncbi:aspartate aminotransferase family protein [Hellea balneolensis]|uniref:aspartate aminotransferase family protein n=1 Tax=Hellea balneolensis TaxID=287478 RepID=UPI0004127FE2|nr:aspartate aminotransferase family protein [Hellea balneolensis]
MADGDHLYNTYKPPAQDFVRGEGAYLYTENGDKYLDFIAGISVNCLGHNHPAPKAALMEQADKVWHLSGMFQLTEAKKLAKKYCDALPFAEKVFFTNSGAEAIECAMKTARKFHYDNGQPERFDIITFQGAFHGRTFATINAGGNPKYLKGFGPALPGFIHLPFGDHDALKEAISETTAAILVEPVQGEGGLRPLPEVCLRGLRELCDEKGILLIYDEVQCGAGRTGKLFAHQWAEGAEPDIMAVAKGVGGGFPLGACIATEEAAAGMVPGTHGSTYGGNPLAAAVGNAVWDEISKPEFLEQVERVSNFLKQQFESLKDEFPDVVSELRGKGLLCGMQLKKPAVKIRAMMLEHKLLGGSAGDNVLRLAPPLIITEDHVREAVGILRTCFQQANSLEDFET